MGAVIQGIVSGAVGEATGAVVAAPTSCPTGNTRCELAVGQTLATHPLNRKRVTWCEWQISYDISPKRANPATHGFEASYNNQIGRPDACSSGVPVIMIVENPLLPTPVVILASHS